MKRSSSPKVIIIGIDGGTFDLIRPWVEEKRLPNFERLMKRGLWGDLTSTIPPVTAPAWTSFMTGQNPGKHGLFHFIEPKPNAYEFRFTNAISRNSKTVWRLLSDNNVTVGVINVPMTYPPEPVNGYMISGMDTPDENSDFTYPLELKKELKEVFGDIRLGVQYLGDIRTDKRRKEFLDEVMNIEDKLTNIALYLMEKHPTDVTMLVYRSTDQVQHLFWHYMDKSHPNFDPAGAKQFSSAIFNVYKRIDENIGRILENVSEDTTVMLMSDHGSGPTSGTVLYLNKCLERMGLLKYKRNCKAAIPNLGKRLIRQIDNFLRFFFPSNIKAKLIKIFPETFTRWQARSTGFSNVDWENTIAFCYEVLTFPPDIWINRKGLWPSGIVTDEEYPEVISCLKETLYSLRHPRTGKPLVRKLYEKKEVFDGVHLAAAPDLLIDWWSNDSFIYMPTVSPDGEDFICDITGKKVITGTEWSATHRLEGMVLLKGSQFNTGKLNRSIHITDIAPILLHLFNVSVPDNMDGRIPESIFDAYYMMKNPINYAAGELSPIHDNMDKETYTEDEVAKIEERLRNLGYMN